jgi:hypothetical protein
MDARRVELPEFARWRRLRWSVRRCSHPTLPARLPPEDPRRTSSISPPAARSRLAVGSVTVSRQRCTGGRAAVSRSSAWCVFWSSARRIWRERRGAGQADQRPFRVPRPTRRNVGGARLTRFARDSSLLPGPRCRRRVRPVRARKSSSSHPRTFKRHQPQLRRRRRHNHP